MNEKKRIQLSLFADAVEVLAIEKVREQYNPIQYELIKCHITLCREHELANLEPVLATLPDLMMPAIQMQFGPIRRFAEGKGVWLPSSGNTDPYYSLRNEVLKNVITSPEKPEPHITLMHPRNSSCTDEIFQQLLSIHFPSSLQFRTISLIEQINSGKWRVLDEFPLNDT